MKWSWLAKQSNDIYNYKLSMKHVIHWNHTESNNIYQNMNFVSDPKDEAYKGSDIMYMRVANQHTLTLLKYGFLFLLTPWVWCQGRKREENVLNSKSVFKGRKISTDGSLEKMTIVQTFPRHNLAMNFFFLLLNLSPMPLFYRHTSSLFQTSFRCERGEDLINGGVSSPMDGQRSQIGEGLEVWKASLEIS